MTCRPPALNLSTWLFSEESGTLAAVPADRDVRLIVRSSASSCRRKDAIRARCWITDFLKVSISKQVSFRASLEISASIDGIGLIPLLWRRCKQRNFPSNAATAPPFGFEEVGRVAFKQDRAGKCSSRRSTALQRLERKARATPVA